MRLAAGTLNSKMYGLAGDTAARRTRTDRQLPKVVGQSAERRRTGARCMLSSGGRSSSRRWGPFDLPDNVSELRRARLHRPMPTAALTLLNNKGVREQASALATRLLRETDGSFWRKSQGVHGYESAAERSPRTSAATPWSFSGRLRSRRRRGATDAKLAGSSRTVR